MRHLIVAALLLLPTAAALAAIQAETTDGKKVMLMQDGTWHYVDVPGGDEPQTAPLFLEKIETLARGCRLGLRLQNDLRTDIRSLVLRFTAYKPGEIKFETVTRGFAFLKPTTSQYQEIQFRGITCGEIEKVQVTGARKCHVGDLTKYSDSAKTCLGLVDVRDSDKMTIFK